MGPGCHAGHEVLRTARTIALYREAVGLGREGLGMAEVDRRTGEILQILGPTETPQ